MDLAAVFQRLESAGIEIDLAGRLRATVLIAEVASRGGDAGDPHLLALHLAPLFARTPEDTARVHAALSAGERAASRASNEPADAPLVEKPKAKAKRALPWKPAALAVLGVIILGALGAAALHVAPRFLTPAPVQTPKVAAPQTEQAAPVAAPPPERAPDSLGSSLGAAGVQLLGGATLSELWNARAFDQPPQVVADRMGVGADQLLALEDPEVDLRLLAALSGGSSASGASAAKTISAKVMDAITQGAAGDARQSLLGGRPVTPTATAAPDPLGQISSQTAQKPWSTAELARWMRTRISARAQALPDASLARIAATRAAAGGQVLTLSDPPWAVVAQRQTSLWTQLRRLAPTLAGLAILGLGVSLWWAASRRPRGFLDRPVAGRPAKVIELALTGLVRRWWDQKRLVDAVRRLSERQTRGSRLDMDATAQATAHAAGLFTLVTRPQFREPEYLFLIDSRGRADHAARLVQGYLKRLGDSKIDVAYAYFERAPDRVRDDFGKPLRRLETLATRASGRRLILVGDAASLTSQPRWKRSDWARLVRAWSGVFLPTSPVELWGREERSLARELNLELLDGSLQGLSGLSHDMEAGFVEADAPAPSQWQPVWTRSDWDDDIALNDDGLAALDADLDRFLGYHGVRWLKACCVYPVLVWDLTLALGQTLTDHAGRPISTEDRLARLTALPWFKTAEIPDRLRAHWVDGLGAADATLVRTFLADVLERLERIAGPADDPTLSFGLGQADGLLTDTTFVNFVHRRPKDRKSQALEATRRLQALLDTSRFRRMVRLSALIWLMAAAAAAPTVVNLVSSLDGVDIGAPIMLVIGIIALVGVVGFMAALPVVVVLLGRTAFDLAPSAWRGVTSGLAPLGRDLINTLTFRPDRRPPQMHPIKSRGISRWLARIDEAVNARRSRASLDEDRRARLIFMSLGFGVVLVGLGVAAVTTTFSHPYNFTSDTGPTGSRADLVDRNGVVLATDAISYDLYVNARRVTDPAAARSQILQAFPAVSADTLDKILASNSYRKLIGNLNPQDQRAARRLNIAGVVFTATPVRTYPNGNLGAHLIGITDTQGRGLSGAEGALDSDITGAALARIPIRLAMDVRVQQVLEQELLTAAQTYKAKAAAGIVTNARTGEILALANIPTFPNGQASQASSDALVNRAASSVYEMGPLVGSFVTAATLDANKGAAAPPASPETAQAYFQKLGLLSPAKVELRESARPLLPRTWNAASLATVSRGQAIALSPLSATEAFGTLVNGGLAVPLTIRAAPWAPGGDRVLSQQTSALMLDQLRRNVVSGTGRDADAPGLRVGAAQSTSVKAVMGRYDPAKTVVFVSAAFPTDGPIGGDRYLVFVLIDEPQGVPGAGFTADAVAKRVIDRSAGFLGVARSAGP